MKDSDCVYFLQKVLPQLHMRWPGFRKVRKQVCKRINRRMLTLQLAELPAYIDYLDHHPEEWGELEQLFQITISCFYRNKGIFKVLQEQTLPNLAKAARQSKPSLIRCWCAGCASGEEPYSLALLWDSCLQSQYPDVDFQILATDINPLMLSRAQHACYSLNSLSQLPKNMMEQAFTHHDNVFCLRQSYRQRVRFLCHDVRTSPPKGSFHMILCRNLAFTYFDEQQQCKVLGYFEESLLPGGILLTGVHERLPEMGSRFCHCLPLQGFYQKAPSMSYQH